MIPPGYTWLYSFRVGSLFVSFVERFLLLPPSSICISVVLAVAFSFDIDNRNCVDVSHARLVSDGTLKVLNWIFSFSHSSSSQPLGGAPLPPFPFPLTCWLWCLTEFFIHPGFSHGLLVISTTFPKGMKNFMAWSRSLFPIPFQDRSVSPPPPTLCCCSFWSSSVPAYSTRAAGRKCRVFLAVCFQITSFVPVLPLFSVVTFFPL